MACLDYSGRKLGVVQGNRRADGYDTECGICGICMADRKFK